MTTVWMIGQQLLCVRASKGLTSRTRPTSAAGQPNRPGVTIVNASHDEKRRSSHVETDVLELIAATTRYLL